MTPKKLDANVHREIQELCAQGDALVKQSQFEKAFAIYLKALDLLPRPLQEWEVSTGILAAIGDSFFVQGLIAKSAATFEYAVQCPGGLGNPFIHLRLGQCYFELGDEDRAADELTRAYMGSGREVLERENAKYIRFLETRLVDMP